MNAWPVVTIGVLWSIVVAIGYFVASASYPDPVLQAVRQFEAAPLCARPEMATTPKPESTCYALIDAPVLTVAEHEGRYTYTINDPSDKTQLIEFQASDRYGTRYRGQIVPSDSPPLTVGEVVRVKVYQAHAVAVTTPYQTIPVGFYPYANSDRLASDQYLAVAVVIWGAGLVLMVIAGASFYESSRRPPEVGVL